MHINAVQFLQSCTCCCDSACQRCLSSALLSENVICITSLREMITNIRSNIWWRLATGKQIFPKEHVKTTGVCVRAQAPCAHSCPPDWRTSKWCGSSSEQADRQTDRRVCSIGPFVATGLQAMLGAVQVSPHDLQQGQESNWETRQRTFSFCGRADRYCSGSQRE